jgi:hypothetical protein
MSLTLVIGSKRFSSWSLRPWIALRHANIPFGEVLIPLRRADTKSRILAYGAAGQVPILIDGGTTVWESLAIPATRMPVFGRHPCPNWRSPSRWPRKCTGASPRCGANSPW